MFCFPIDHSKAVPLLQFCFVLASVVSYVALVLSLFVPRLSFFCCLIPCVSSFIFLCTNCLGLFALPLGAIVRLVSIII